MAEKHSGGGSSSGPLNELSEKQRFLKESTGDYDIMDPGKPAEAKKPSAPKPGDDGYKTPGRRAVEVGGKLLENTFRPLKTAGEFYKGMYDEYRRPKRTSTKTAPKR